MSNGDVGSGFGEAWEMKAEKVHVIMRTCRCRHLFVLISDDSSKLLALCWWLEVVGHIDGCAVGR